jgi:hypothetical protein
MRQGDGSAFKLSFKFREKKDVKPDLRLSPFSDTTEILGCLVIEINRRHSADLPEIGDASK